MLDRDVTLTVVTMTSELRVFDCPGMTKVRLGRQGDGGYVVMEEPLRNLSMLYSYGIGNDTTFEADLIDKTGAAACLYDPTIDEPEDIPPGAKFIREPFAERRVKRNSMIKCDVEGAEWEILPRWSPDELKKVDQLVIEFHFVHVAPQPGLSPYFAGFYQSHCDRINQSLFFKYWLTLNRLNRIFRLFHVHVNNSLPPVEIGEIGIYPLIECSFINQALVPDALPSDGTYPVDGLDFPNKHDRPDAQNIKPPERLC